MRTSAKALFGLLIAIAIFFAGYAANRHSVPLAPSNVAKASLTYSCPMHPQYTSDHPGDCPICGMRLEPVGGGNGRAGADQVTVGAARQQLIGVRTDAVTKASSSHVLRVPGRIAVDDQRLYRIVSAVDGYILDLGDNTVGRFVRKDQLLASYYTRDLLSTERLFLLSVPANDPLQTQAKDFSQASIRTAGSANPQFPIDSLRGLGMNDLQIEEIHRTRTAAPQVNIYAPVSGFVLARNISPKQRFDKGAELYRIADITHLWVLTDIFEKDRQFLKPGAEASIVYQGRRFRARMSDALPQFDAVSRTLKTRFELDNADHLLQPDMFVDVEIEVEMPPAITVAADALFDSGLRKTVFVDRGDGNFEARRVEIGWRLGDRVEILKGLMEGERVVGSASFLLDSESRMKAASAGIFTPETDPVCGMEVDQKRAVAAHRAIEHDGTTYYFCSEDCKHKFEQAPDRYVHTRDASPQKPSAPAVAMAAAMVAREVTDPVCGMAVDPKDPAIARRTATYKGTTYYFCSDDCQQKFEKTPEQYLAKRH